jgi:hypothetical protein
MNSSMLANSAMFKDFIEYYARRSVEAAFRNRFFASRPENSKCNGLPSVEVFADVDPYRVEGILTLKKIDAPRQIS